MSDYKTSLLVNSQVPEFVREEHPKFIAFLEAYYEFLEKKQGTEINDLTSKAKQLRYISDVDVSLEDFENSFFNTYASLVPQDVSVDKNFLIKNILPIYLAKGSESSFKLLFKLFFGEDVTITYPKNRILRASDGKWNIENAIRVDSTIKSYYLADGITKEFPLPQEVDSNTIGVYIDGALQTNNYYIKKESKKIVFTSAPAANLPIKISYTSFDTALLHNRKLTGVLSGATSIIQRVDPKTIAGDNYLQFYVDGKKTTGTFTNGEVIVSEIIDGNNRIGIELKSLSSVKSITIIDGGSTYNVGDPVPIFIRSNTSNVTIQAKAIVDNVVTGLVNSISVLYGGSGFQVNNNVYAVGISTESFNASVASIDTSGGVTSSGTIAPNTVTFFTDLISDIDIANVTINAANYGFPSSNVTENVNTVLAVAFSSKTINIGPITAVNISNTYSVNNPLLLPKLDVTSSLIKDNGTVRLRDYGIIGDIRIVSSGQNYSVGDYLVFTNKPGVYSGIGANAQVASVGAGGRITSIRINNGGLGYVSDFPTINVQSATGSNAVLTVRSIMGDNEVLRSNLPRDRFGNPITVGEIVSIKIINPGQGYDIVPSVDLSQAGDGLATANVQLQDSYETLPGKWITTDGLISSEDRRLEGLDYFIDFSYVLSSKVQFSKYKDIFKSLIHPAGMKQYAEYQIDGLITANTPVSSIVRVSNTVSGTVNVNNSIYVIGTNTKFNIANTKGILTIGTKIAIGSNISYVNAIYSNTVLTVNTAFSFTSNQETLVIL